MNTPHVPTRGSDVEAWIKRARDGAAEHVPTKFDDSEAAGAWTALDDLLDDYRLRADTGTPLDGHVCEGGCGNDCPADATPYRVGGAMDPQVRYDLGETISRDGDTA